MEYVYADQHMNTGGISEAWYTCIRMNSTLKAFGGNCRERMWAFVNTQCDTRYRNTLIMKYC